jgi:pimeloyl-ACP methyl ester carboxylesterase
VGHVQVGAVDVAFDEAGPTDGTPVVLVHGTTGSRATWLMQTPVLSARWRVVLPEYAGSGETTDPGGPLEVDDLAAQVAGVADHLGLDRYHLAGYSLGAVVAAAVAAAQPDRIQSLALVCGWAKSDAQMRFQFDFWQRLLAADDLELFARYALTDGFTNKWFELMGGDVATIEAAIPMMLAGLAPGSHRQAELDGRVDIADRLGAITAPTLVVGGRRDRFVPIEHSWQLAEQIAGARLVELDAGHVIPAELGQELAEVLDRWFGEH